MNTLTVRMREALQDAARQELRRVHDDQPGRPAWPAHPSTLAALVGHGLLERSERKSRQAHRLEVWTITPAGVQVLNPAPRQLEQAARYLSRPSRTTGDYTSNPRRSIDELEAVDAPLRWVEQSARVRREAQDRRERASQLRRSVA